MGDVLQVAGALALLVPFVLTQFGRMTSDSLAYIVLNAAGSSLLAVLAALGRDWGFLLLEATWAAVAWWSLVARGRRRAQ